MTTRTKQLALAVTGTAVLASAAYGLGTQADDGNAEAAKARSSTTQQQAPPSRHGNRLADLAKELGVTEDKLRAALDAVRTKQDEDRADPRTAQAKALADALGKPVADVQQALESVHPDPLAAVAKALGKSTDEVRKAFEADRPQPGGRDGRGRHEGAGDLAAVAKALGVTTKQLRAALRDARPQRGDRGGERAALAKALGVTEEQLAAAEQKLRDAFDQERKDRQAAFAKALAGELGLDEAKVAKALGDEPFAGGPGHGPEGGPGDRPEGGPEGGPGDRDDDGPHGPDGAGGPDGPHGEEPGERNDGDDGTSPGEQKAG